MAIAAFGCQGSDAVAAGRRSENPGDAFAAGLVEFLGWAHPPDAQCSAVEHIEVLARWHDGMRVRFEVPCLAGTRALEAILETREGNGVWQVAAGIEAREDDIRAAVTARLLRFPRETRANEVSPPPGNTGGAEDSPLSSVAPPQPRRKVTPEFPEEAGRARMIGEAHVELLVDLSSQGLPNRARPLRGPDPDLGMRQAALTAVMRWGFSPAALGGLRVRFFAPIEITFNGLPAESRSWSHRALFDLEAMVFPDRSAAETAGGRLRAGEPLETVAPGSALDSDWGLVAAAELPAPLRRALHEAPIGVWVGPVAAEGGEYVARKRGEVYYGILPSEGDTLQYQVVHQRDVADGNELRQAIDSDILSFMAERQRRDYMNEAARRMGIRQRRGRSGQLLIYTDVLNDEEIELLGRLVEAAFRAHQEFWAGLTTLRLFRSEVSVYAFGRRADHQSVQQVWQGRRASGPPPAVGEYIPASRILAFPCEPTGGHVPIPIAIHEAIHMLNYERVYGPRAQPSRWFEEGLANYFGFSQVDSQLRIDVGEIRRSATISAGSAQMQFDPRAELREHLRRTHVEGAVGLRQLVAAGPDDPLWVGAQAARAYGAAWTLVHFLMHGDHGRHLQTFRQYAAREARGAGGLKAFQSLFGDKLDDLEAAWHDYEENM